MNQGQGLGRIYTIGHTDNQAKVMGIFIVGSLASRNHAVSIHCKGGVRVPFRNRVGQSLSFGVGRRHLAGLGRLLVLGIERSLGIFLYPAGIRHHNRSLVHVGDGNRSRSGRRLVAGGAILILYGNGQSIVLCTSRQGFVVYGTISPNIPLVINPEKFLAFTTCNLVLQGRVFRVISRNMTVCIGIDEGIFFHRARAIDCYRGFVFIQDIYDNNNVFIKTGTGIVRNPHNKGKTINVLKIQFTLYRNFP